MHAGGSTEQAQAIRVAIEREGLSAIRAPGCAAAVWTRPTEPPFLAWIGALDPDRLPRLCVVLRTAGVRAALEAACAEAGMPDVPVRAAFIDDATGLAHGFASLMSTSYLRLRVEPVTTDVCRRFHIDAVFARLICTYRGAGTQLSPNAGTPGDGRILAVPTGAALLLRGTLWPEDPPSGLLHRSPPIEGTGETRLLYVIDPIADPEDAA